MKKGLMLIAVVMAVLLSFSAIAECPDDATAEQKKNNPSCPEFKASPDNINDVPVEQISEIPSSQITPEIISSMDVQRMAALTEEQLSDVNLLRRISEQGRLDALNRDNIRQALNSHGGVDITNIKSMEGVTITGTTPESLFIQDANGNGFRLTSGGKGKVNIDNNGLINIEGGEGLAIWYNGNRLADFSGTGTMSSNGEFICSPGSACSISAFGSQPITVIYGPESDKVIVLQGTDANPAKFEIGADGKIKEIDGTLLEGSDEEIIIGDPNGKHYKMKLKKGAKIKFKNGQLFSLVPGEGEGEIKIEYFDKDKLLAKASYKGDGSDKTEIKMFEDKSAEIVGCDEGDYCSYTNYVNEHLDGVYVPEDSRLELTAGNNGGVFFDATGERTITEITGKNAAASINNGADVYVSTMSTADSTVNVQFGGEFPSGDQNTVIIRDGYNIVGRGKNLDVAAGDNHITIGNEMKMQAWVMINDAGIPMLDVKREESILNAPLLTSIAKVSINGETIDIMTTGIAPPRDSDIKGDFILTSTNPDESKGEILYWKGNMDKHVLLEVQLDEFGSIKPGYGQIKTWGSDLGITVNDKEKPDVIEVLRELGMTDSEIIEIRNRWNYKVFTESDLGIEPEQPETPAPAPADGTEKPAGEPQADGTEKPAGEVAATREYNPQDKTYGRIPGVTDNNPEVQAAIKSVLGDQYNPNDPDGNIRKLQQKWNTENPKKSIKADGDFGYQTLEILGYYCDGAECNSYETVTKKTEEPVKAHEEKLKQQDESGEDLVKSIIPGPNKKKVNGEDVVSKVVVLSPQDERKMETAIKEMGAGEDLAKLDAEFKAGSIDAAEYKAGKIGLFQREYNKKYPKEKKNDPLAEDNTYGAVTQAAVDNAINNKEKNEDVPQTLAPEKNRENFPLTAMGDMCSLGEYIKEECEQAGFVWNAPREKPSKDNNCKGLECGRYEYKDLNECKCYYTKPKTEEYIPEQYTDSNCKCPGKTMYNTEKKGCVVPDKPYPPVGLICGVA
ncbi:MAG: hypothetical protein KKE20_03640 [Nanoarchaeota archaeon]|nr:hypothetical protein [Nanoarchaeota archaeon]